MSQQPDNVDLIMVTFQLKKLAEQMIVIGQALEIADREALETAMHEQHTPGQPLIPPADWARSVRVELDRLIQRWGT